MLWHTVAIDNVNVMKKCFLTPLVDDAKQKMGKERSNTRSIVCV